jgi:hypothetical protein
MDRIGSISGSDRFRTDPITGGPTITMLKAGDVVITADADGRCGSVTLHATAATDAEWQAGNQRYNNGNPLPKFEGDGGVPVNLSSTIVDPPGEPPACTNCHDGVAPFDFLRTVPYTPKMTAGLSDQELIDIVTKGDLPVDPLFDPAAPASVTKFFHTWSDISGDGAKGIVVYLRTLTSD